MAKSRYGTYWSGRIRGGKGTGVKGVSGVKETVARIKAMQDDIPKILATSVLSGAMLVNNSAKEVVPVRTGNLMRSIHPELTNSTRTFVTVAVGTDVEYAPYVELGTSKQAARPYLRPSLDKNQDKVREEIRRDFRILLAKHCKGKTA